MYVQDSALVDSWLPRPILISLGMALLVHAALALLAVFREIELPKAQLQTLNVMYFDVPKGRPVLTSADGKFTLTRPVPPRIEANEAQASERPTRNTELPTVAQYPALRREVRAEISAPLDERAAASPLPVVDPTEQAAPADKTSALKMNTVAAPLVSIQPQAAKVAPIILSTSSSSVTSRVEAVSRFDSEARRPRQSRALAPATVEREVRAVPPRIEPPKLIPTEPAYRQSLVTKKTELPPMISAPDGRDSTLPRSPPLKLLPESAQLFPKLAPGQPQLASPAAPDSAVLPQVFTANVREEIRVVSAAVPPQIAAAQFPAVDVNHRASAELPSQFPKDDFREFRFETQAALPVAPGDELRLAPVIVDPAVLRDDEYLASLPAAVIPSSRGIALPTAPRYLNNPIPRYPEAARRVGIQGMVLLDVLVNRDGLVRTVRLKRSSGSQQLDIAAKIAVNGWRFQPGSYGGEPVNTWVTVPIKFQISAQRSR